MKPRLRRYVLLAVLLLAAAATTGWMIRRPSGPVIPTADVPRAAGWEAVTVVAGLERPWSFAWLPSGDILVTERPGRLRVIRGGQLLAQPVAGLPETLAKGQGGLMDLALHPRFAENRWVYFTYATGTSEANATRLARARLAADGSALTGLEVLHTVSPLKPGGQHFGSRLLWLPDGTLLLAVGDGGNPPTRLDGELIREQAQDRASQLGKVLRLRDDGTAPADNPFVGQAGADPLLWTLGHRNIQGLARDPVSGRLWATEHGSRGGDELNLLAAGANYGWPRATYGIEYTFGTISPHTTLPGMVDPLVVWTPAQAPSGLLVYTGDRFPAWRGDLFSGGLKSGEVRRIDLDASGQVIGQEKLPIGARVRDVRQGPDGLIYLLTDEKDGQLLRLQPTP